MFLEDGSMSRNGLDHWGSTHFAGRQCFVTEPYIDFEEGLLVFRKLALALGCADIVSRVSEHGFGTIRVLLLPLFQEGAVL